jgi:hypothetical protein
MEMGTRTVMMIIGACKCKNSGFQSQNLLPSVNEGRIDKDSINKETVKESAIDKGKVDKGLFIGGRMIDVDANNGRSAIFKDAIVGG